MRLGRRRRRWGRRLRCRRWRRRRWGRWRRGRRRCGRGHRCRRVHRRRVAGQPPGAAGPGQKQREEQQPQEAPRRRRRWRRRRRRWRWRRSGGGGGGGDGGEGGGGDGGAGGGAGGGAVSAMERVIPSQTTCPTRSASGKLISTTSKSRRALSTTAGPRTTTSLPAEGATELGVEEMLGLLPAVGPEEAAVRRAAPDRDREPVGHRSAGVEGELGLAAGTRVEVAQRDLGRLHCGCPPRRARMRPIFSFAATSMTPESPLLALSRARSSSARIQSKR